MLYAILCKDNPSSKTLREQHIQEHRDRIAATKQAGHIFMAGPLHRDDEEQEIHGSLIIVEFDTIEEAQQWADAEPFLKYGIYESVSVTKFKQLF